MAIMSIRVSFYRDRKKNWRWRASRIRNGKVMADSAEGYRRPGECIRAAEILFAANPDVEFQFPSGPARATK